jgi:hypothetical protein
MFFKTVAREIYTPSKNFDGNEIAIKTPEGWGYRTLPSKNGLIGVLWPLNSGTISFNNADTVIFVFLQCSGGLPDTPTNVNLYEEKCTKSTFKFATEDDHRDSRKSIYEKYFNGPCGSTMVIFEETIYEKYHLICALVSAKKEISQFILHKTKEIVKNYKKEIELAIEYKKAKNMHKKKQM